MPSELDQLCWQTDHAEHVGTALLKPKPQTISGSVPLPRNMGRLVT